MKEEIITDEHLDLYKFVIELLNGISVPYWLDQGSLLGVVRENRFLPWDHDVDLGIWKEDYIANKRKIHKILQDKGVRITYLPYVTKMRYYIGSKKSIPVNIRLYHREQGYAYSEFWSFLSKDEKLIKRNKNYLRKMKKSTNLHKRLIRKPATKYLLFPVYLLNKLFFQFLLHLREALKTRRVVFRVDEKYFLNLESRDVYGLKTMMPEDPEKYIALKYGEKWREPNKGWVWYEDDGGSYAVDHFKMNSFKRNPHFNTADYERRIKESE